MNPRKLTKEQQARIREVVRLRNAIPTNADLAREMGCSIGLINQFTAGRTYDEVIVSQNVPCGTSDHQLITKLHDTSSVELGLAKP